MGSPDCGRRRTEHVCGQRGGEGVQWVRGAERRLVPCEVTYPARSSTPARMSAAGPRVAPCPCPLAREREACRRSLRKDQEREPQCLRLFPTPGGHSSCPSEWDGPADCARAEGTCAWMRAAGRGVLFARHQAASLRPGPTARRLTRDAHTRALRGGGLNLVDAMTGRPGEKRAASMRACRPLAHSPRACPHLLGIEECPH